MNEGPLLPVSARRNRPVGLFLVGVGAFALGLFAVGPGHLYRGDTWPDYLAMLAASVCILAAVVEWAGRDRAGSWSWLKLRGPSFLACGLAFVLLVVLSAIVPVEPGVWPEGDSAQGFSMFAFLGSLAVAIAATVKAPRSVGVTQLAGDSSLQGMRSPGAVRIALRRYPFLSRESYVDVDGTGASLVVPRVFGGGRRWFIPIGAIGVVVPDQDAAADDEPASSGDGEWVTRHEFRVPYLSTTSPFAPPNLTLLFTVPQRIPPIRWFAGRDLDISPRATRNEAGFTVDGVEVRAVDPETAEQALLARGAQGVTDPDSFVQRHRDVVRDREEVRAVVGRARRSFLLTAFSGIATLALFIAFKTTDDDRYGIGLVAVLFVSSLVERVTRRPRGD